MSCNRPIISPINVNAMLEKNAANALAQTMPLKIAIQGTPVIHKRMIKRSENSLYGRYAGVPKDAQLIELGNEKVLMSATHWRTIDGLESGYFDNPGFMYCTFDLLDGDVLSVVRADKAQIDFTATQVQSIGNQITILKRFMMSNIAGS